MNIEYNHTEKIHTLTGPQAALPALLGDLNPSSLLDIGCGTGNWLRVALDIGIPDVFGVDGVKVPADEMHVQADKILHHDLTQPFNLNRMFDAAICLEVAEHLDPSCAAILIDTIVRHSNRIYFSAAAPGQDGQHHLNCQWPAYWQELFNERGFVCEDSLRWQIWDNPSIEPWYRQNIFSARRDPISASTEPRIKSVVHPKMLSSFVGFENHVSQIEDGRMKPMWYLTLPALAFSRKLNRRFSKGK